MPVQDEFATLHSCIYVKASHKKSSVNLKSCPVQLQVAQSRAPWQNHSFQSTKQVRVAKICIFILSMGDKVLFLPLHLILYRMLIVCAPHYSTNSKKAIYSRGCMNVPRFSCCLKFLLAFQNHLAKQPRLQLGLALEYLLIFLRGGKNNCFLVARNAKQTIIKLFIFPIHRTFPQNSSSALNRKIMNRNKNKPRWVMQLSCWTSNIQHTLSSRFRMKKWCNESLSWMLKSLSSLLQPKLNLQPVTPPDPEQMQYCTSLFFLYLDISREQACLQVIFWGMAPSPKEASLISLCLYRRSICSNTVAEQCSATLKVYQMRTSVTWMSEHN